MTLRNQLQLNVTMFGFYRYTVSTLPHGMSTLQNETGCSGHARIVEVNAGQETETNRQTGKKTDRQVDRHRDGHRDGRTDGQTGRQACRLRSERCRERDKDRK